MVSAMRRHFDCIATGFSRRSLVLTGPQSGVRRGADMCNDACLAAEENAGSSPDGLGPCLSAACLGALATTRTGPGPKSPQETRRNRSSRGTVL